MGGATTPGLCVPVEFRSHYLQKRAVLFKKERKHCALRAIQPRQHCALNQVGTLIASARDRDRAIALRVNIYTFRVNSAPRASSFRAANILSTTSGRPSRAAQAGHRFGHHCCHPRSRRQPRRAPPFPLLQ